MSLSSTLERGQLKVPTQLTCQRLFFFITQYTTQVCTFWTLYLNFKSFVCGNTERNCYAFLNLNLKILKVKNWGKFCPCSSLSKRSSNFDLKITKKKSKLLMKVVPSLLFISAVFFIKFLKKPKNKKVNNWIQDIH